MAETVRYTYRLRSGAQAEAALTAEWHRCRWLWNEAVHQQKTGNKPTFAKLSKLLTQARGRSAWLRDGSHVTQQQTLRCYAQALQHSFTVKGRGRPRFKKRKVALPSLEYTRRGFVIREGRLRVAGGISLPVVWSRELPSVPSSVRVYQDSLGHWYASFVVRRDTTPAPGVTGRIGIDWGVTTTATATDPEFDLPYAGHRKACAAQLAKAQRRMSRRRRPGLALSKGYQRARRDTAKLHKKAQRQNTHTARTWAKKVVGNHQVIAVEDFKPLFLGKSTMAKKAADAAISAAKKTLIEYGTRAGRTVVLVPPAYTTMTCAECAAIAKARLSLGERTFRCDHCGHIAARDRNAARVILMLATGERARASADDVRHLRPPSGVFADAV